MNLIYWAIILTGLIGIMGALNGHEKFKKFNNFFSISIIILTIISIVIGGYVIREQDKITEYTNDVGKISGKLEAKNIIIPKVYLPDGKSSASGFSVYGGGPLSAWIENGEIKVSKEIRGKDGNIVMEIIGNEWKVAPVGPEAWDKNFDKNAFEVIDDEKNVRFQIEFDGKAAKVAFIEYSEKGEKTGIGCIKENGSCIGVTAGRLPLDFKIDPIFKYPSELHPGERIN